MQQITETLSITTILQRGPDIRAHELYLPVLLLILASAFTKSAQFPFHMWLPAAMEAPTPVSAYLHSATMVKAGIYLVARLHPALGGTDAWMAILIAVGGVTMVAGALLAYVKNDLKQLLAYSTVSALGMLTFALGLAGELGTKAAIVFLIAHSLYKGALFMVAGAVDHEAGTRDVTALGGLWRPMRVTAAAGALAALSMAGLPPLFGFIAKELFYEASQASAAWAPLMIAGAVLTGILTVAAAGLAGFGPFIGPPRPTPKQAHEGSFGLWLGPISLALAGLYFGLAPGVVGARLVSRATSEILAVPTAVKLAIYHGLNVTLWLSLFTILAGVILFAQRDRIYPRVRFIGAPVSWSPAALYDLGLLGLLWIASWQTRLLQNGYLPHYLRVVLATSVLLVGIALGRSAGAPRQDLLGGVRPYEALTGVLIAAGAISAVASRSRLAAVTSLGVVALGLALTFVLFAAPDLAMTQFLVETLTVILIVLVMYHLPKYTLNEDRRNRVRDGVVAIGAGSLMTILVLAVTSVQVAPEISRYYVENSYKLAHGRNIVNVILVDFRGLDTLGEITVLAIAAIGVFALLKLRPRPRKEDLP